MTVGPGNPSPFELAGGSERSTNRLPDESAELLRLRDKFHDLEKQVWGYAALEKEHAREHARGLGELRDDLRSLAGELETLEVRVDTMTEAEKIAAAVSTGIRQDRRRRWTLPRKGASIIVALVLLVPALHDLVTWF